MVYSVYNSHNIAHTCNMEKMAHSEGERFRVSIKTVLMVSISCRPNRLIPIDYKASLVNSNLSGYHRTPTLSPLSLVLVVNRKGHYVLTLDTPIQHTVFTYLQLRPTILDNGGSWFEKRSLPATMWRSASSEYTVW